MRAKYQSNKNKERNKSKHKTMTNTNSPKRTEQLKNLVSYPR